MGTGREQPHRKLQKSFCVSDMRDLAGITAALAGCAAGLPAGALAGFVTEAVAAGETDRAVAGCAPALAAGELSAAVCGFAAKAALLLAACGKRGSAERRQRQKGRSGKPGRDQAPAPDFIRTV